MYARLVLAPRIMIGRLLNAEFRERYRKIMSTTPPCGVDASMPSEHRENGHHYVMISRYVLASVPLTGKKIIDAGCGLGWGDYILGILASSVTGVDIDVGCIDFCRRTWSDDKKLSFIPGNVPAGLDFDCGSFGAAVSMEMIEHFDKNECINYLREIYRLVAPGGMLMGSSAFTSDREKAESMLKSNPDHKRIYSSPEFSAMLLSVGFERPTIFREWMFAARRPNGV